MAEDSRDPRPSTDQETAPLLQDPDSSTSNSPAAHQNGYKSFTHHVNAITQEPLTPLTKILLVLTLILLLLASIFIGLFAGAQHKLNSIGDSGGDKPSVTRIVTATATSTEVHTSTVQSGPTVPTKTPEDVCNTPQCVKLSASLLQALDETQDPCEDFYQFANGGWFETNDIPAGRGSFGIFDQVAQQNKRIIRKLLESSELTATNVPLDDKQILIKLHGLYASCMNEDLLDERGIAPLMDVVKNVQKLYGGDYPKIDMAVATRARQVPLTAGEQRGNLTAAIAYLHSRGIGALFGFDIDGDVGVDPNAMSLWFSQPQLGLPSKEYYEEKPIRELYQQTLTRMLIALDDTEEDKALVNKVQDPETSSIWPPWPWPPWGDDDKDKNKKPINKTAHAEELAKKVVKFERQLAKASLDLEDLYQDPIGTYNPMPFPAFAASLPQIHFPTYFSTFTPRNFPASVIVTSTTYPGDLSSILAEADSDVISAYLVTRASLALAPMLGMSTDVWQAKRALEEVLQGIKKGQVPDRSDWCVQKVEDALGFAAGRFFVQETFGGESKKKGTKVITDVIEAFKMSLQNLEWMDKKSANAATEKADAIRIKVGFPLSPDTTSARSIAQYYNLVHIDKAKFMENMLSAFKSDEYKKWQQLGKQRDVESWEMYPSMVNAYFNPPANEIVFPAGILRPPYFSQEWPAYLSYGAFGQVAAHELTHAFDSAGRLYNQQGKLEQWWTNTTSEEFMRRQTCIVEQYSKYTIDDGKGGKVNVNGNLTSGENIGDSGLVQAYRAWQAQYHSSLLAGQEYLLPGLNYTQEQLFFIAFGQVWAQTIKPQAAVQRVRTDPHSPNKYRVEGTISNIPEFAKAFNCSASAKLNPPREKQCRFW